MNGLGVAKGLMVTLKHFAETFADDVRYGFRKYSNQVDNFEERQGARAKGAFTVQYPDEKIAVPERFRFVPFLIVNDADHPTDAGSDWCTSCGICAKVCPPQCIWIVRGNNPETGRPIPEPENFFIDTDICMNCGFCAEYCPFDAIKMDHDYELASYDRTTAHIHDKERLSKPHSYWRHIAPTRAWEEANVRGTWEHKNVKGSDLIPTEEQLDRDVPIRVASAEPVVVETTADTAPAEATPEAPAAAPSAEAETAPATSSDGPNLGDEEARRKRREAALARKAKRQAMREAAAADE